MIDGNRAVDTTDAVTIDPKRGGLTLSESQTRVEHAPIPAEEIAAITADVATDQLKKKIAAARADAAVGIVKAAGEIAMLHLGRGKIAELEKLDPTLVSVKIGQLQKRNKRGEEMISQLQTEIEWCSINDEQLDAEEAHLDPDMELADAGEVARPLAALGSTYQKKLTVVTTKSWGFDLVANRISRTTGEKRTEHHSTGAIETNESTTKSAQVGKGITGRVEKEKSQTITDDDDQVIAGHERSVTAEAKAIMDPNGARGVGGGVKLKESLENTYGKVFGQVSPNGAFTVNVVPIPNSDQFAVVLTMNVSLGLDVGAEKGVSHRDKAGGGSSPTTGAKGTASASLSASGRAEVTHTHTMDLGGVEKYLAALEATAARKAAGDKPEFGLLRKVLAGLEGVDDMADAASAVIGDPAAVNALADGESIELTLSGEIGASLGLKGENRDGGDKSIGAEGSFKQGASRAVKIGRSRAPATSRSWRSPSPSARPTSSADRSPPRRWA